jgi:pyrroline-5-carboxylate reductase
MEIGFIGAGEIARALVGQFPGGPLPALNLARLD